MTMTGQDLVKWAERVQAAYDAHKRSRDQAASLASIAARRRALSGRNAARSARGTALRALPPGRTEIR